MSEIGNLKDHWSSQPVPKTLEYGITAYGAGLVYIQNMSPEEAGQYMANGYLEFWKSSGLGLEMGALVTLFVGLWMVYYRWRTLGRVMVT